ncbi:MAG: glycosyltransferase [Pegethrix bostrychoides GSE-TBD4-15B]|jgi:glycosyltransferase involved in cell wall biosynthesis|uniref:Glycosyltransferase n=1 Tax=Pegethrix bostrychoides GSE-TBD4-15B TaxID=2839662 RepID=A0A951U672_9CYAN|nr:glycosyltransferase [Pegethrix bostrychoides GSE-TBD4-15B]
MNLNKKKIAVYYPAFLGGGAEAVGLWMLEALQHRHQVTLFTIAQIDFDKLNVMYGTQLSAEKIQIEPLVTGLSEKLINLLISNSQFCRMSLFHALLRRLKSQKDRYDLLISAYNAVDLGKPGIQYVHWVKVLEGNAFYERISDFSLEQLRQNTFITNSATVAACIQKEYDRPSRLIYPPVVLSDTPTAWVQKDDAFICSGRLTVAKEPHRAIQILQQVRQQGFDVKLHLTGGGGGIYAWKYQRYLKQLVNQNADWVTLHENLSYEQYADILGRCKYGIHYKQEPFGISIAEMVKAGAVPFVRSQGGQVEIVGSHNTDLLFANESEAVAQIVSVLQNAQKQAALQDALMAQRQMFSTERFMAEFNQAVDDHFQRQVSTALNQPDFETVIFPRLA